MIIQPFQVHSGTKNYDFIDRQAIDSDSERKIVQQFILMQLALMQDDAKCAALKIPEVTEFENLGFGVYDGATLIGVFLIAALAYQSGPWADLIDWQVTNPNDPAKFFARPMPGFLSLPEPAALDLSVDAAHHFLFHRLTSVNGHGVEFHKFSWAIFKQRTDPNSVAAKKIHDKAKNDNRFSMTEAPDPNDAALTRVDIELS